MLIRIGGCRRNELASGSPPLSTIRRPAAMGAVRTQEAGMLGNVAAHSRRHTASGCRPPRGRGGSSVPDPGIGHPGTSAVQRRPGACGLTRRSVHGNHRLAIWRAGTRMREQLRLGRSLQVQLGGTVRRQLRGWRGTCTATGIGMPSSRRRSACARPGVTVCRHAGRTDTSAPAEAPACGIQTPRLAGVVNQQGREPKNALRRARRAGSAPAANVLLRLPRQKARLPAGPAGVGG